MNKMLLMTVAVCCVVLTSLADVTRVGVDFTRAEGLVKPLDGVCNSPLPFTQGKSNVRELTEMKELGSPFVRLHDTGGPYGRNTLVDIPNVFRDMDADENDPANYDFAFTDAYLEQLVKAGCTPYYRLGVTIENYYRIKAYRIHPPKDFAKYARVCEHVVRHYTKGWANGFRWKMPYWEVWCEPENRQLWLGTRQQFFDLYAAIAREIKAHHPDVRIGGYGACRFENFENLDVNSDDCMSNWLGWFEEFCDYVTAEKTKAPLDFFSWHLYRPFPNRHVWHAKDVRERLDRHGLKDVESHLTEWNIGGKFGIRAQHSVTGAVYVASGLCAFQKAPIDLATLYDAGSGNWGVVFDRFGKPNTVYYSLQKFRFMRDLGTSYAVRDDEENLVYALAAGDGKDKAVLLTNYSFTDTRTVRLDLVGAKMSDFTLYRLDEAHPKFPKIGPAGDSNELVLPPLTAIYLTTEDQHERK